MSEKMKLVDDATVETFGPSLGLVLSGEGVARQIMVREAMTKVAEYGNQCRLLDGALLWEVREQKYWKEWGYKNFDEYCVSELGYTMRTVNYRIQVYTKYIVELGMPAHVMAALDWTKAKELIPIVNENNVDNLLDQASTMSLRDVVKLRNEELQKVSDTEVDDEDIEEIVEEKTVFKTLRFELPEVQFEAVCQALDMVGEETKEKARPSQLVALAHSYIAESVSRTGVFKLQSLQQCVRAIEQVFNVRLQVTEMDYSAYDLTEEQVLEASSEEPVGSK